MICPHLITEIIDETYLDTHITQDTREEQTKIMQRQVSDLHTKTHASLEQKHKEPRVTVKVNARLPLEA